ncbi:glycoside hydrolase family 55 protein [Podospora didyma]|uniref:Glycoside hydrolase family 55 protein n=1 Tax=Podospora didyma TaxID=330526 RepID=A0AAE0KJ24_9PEZI|nr:glycoside hydrolase family 55 protein [Podospora didyma]
MLFSLLLVWLTSASSWASQRVGHSGLDQTGANASTFWYENIKHNGISPFITNGKNWAVFRNVKDYGAKGDGTSDDTAAIQKAISTGDGPKLRNTGSYGATGQPAVVYFPAGTYLVKSTIKSAVGTVLMGNPTNRATLKAAPTFSGSYVIFGHDQLYSGLTGFYHGIKHLVIDSTSVAGSKILGLVEWGVSQNNILSNVMFDMPIGAAGHTGIVTPGMCSGLILNDLQFVGGAVGIALSATQYHLKSISFKNVATAVKITSLVQGTGQGLRFGSCSIGIDATSGGLGAFNLIDSSATNTSTLISSASSSNTFGSLVLENVLVDSSTVKVGGTTVLTGSIEPGVSWIRGNVYHANSTNPKPSNGQKMLTSRPQTLVNGTGFYHTVVPPTYAEYDIAQVINIKDVAKYPVAGDGTQDDTANIQAILNSAASGNKVVYFPYGTYLLSDTLLIPPGSRLVGEAWTQLSGTGAKFKDINNPTPIIKVGNPGDVGVAQMSDFVFTVADILPGAILVQVNMAGGDGKPGTVGFFNCHFRIGGALGSKTQTNCRTPQNCLAARLNLHLAATSSSYWENTWSWTADHDLDGSHTVYPGTLGGFLIEAAGNGTWILGSGVEHHVLYQVNIHNAKNVFIGLQQGEAAYWQGTGNTLLAPAPWSENLRPSDPDFSWCAATDAQCRMGLYQYITGSTNLNIYSSGFWNFVAGPSRAMCTSDCQNSAVLYGPNNTKMLVYGLSTINSRNMISESSGLNGSSIVGVATHAANSGSVFEAFGTGVVAAYFRNV